MVKIGDRVRTCHGPTGNDIGTVQACEYGTVVERGVDTGVIQVWCVVSLDCGGMAMLDWREDGWGRIRVVGA